MKTSNKVTYSWFRGIHPFKRLNNVLNNPTFIATVVATVIATLISTCATNLTTTYFENRRQRENLLKSIQSIYIGSNKEWVDNQLGPAAYSSQASDYLQCVYLTDLASVRVFYDVPSNKCCAFFVTQMNQGSECKLFLPTAYSYATDGKALGEYSYYEISESPMWVFGYTSNGVARALYGEAYYYRGSGNYYDFYFLSFDYGEYSSYRALCNSIEPIGRIPTIDDEVNKNQYYNDYSQLITDRKNVCPNTYGISNIPSNIIIGLISDYSAFDSVPFREENYKKYYAK